MNNKETFITGNDAVKTRKDSSSSARQNAEVYGPYGPIGRCHTIVVPKDPRLRGHRATFVDETLFNRKSVKNDQLPKPTKPVLKDDSEDKSHAEHNFNYSRPHSRAESASNKPLRQSRSRNASVVDSNVSRPQSRMNPRPPSQAANMLNAPIAGPPTNTSMVVQYRPKPKTGASNTKSTLSPMQKWQTRYRPTRARPSEVQFGLFSPLSDNLFWSSMMEWNKEEMYSKAIHGMFDTDAVKSVNDTAVKQCIFVQPMPMSTKHRTDKCLKKGST